MMNINSDYVILTEDRWCDNLFFTVHYREIGISGKIAGKFKKGEIKKFLKKQIKEKLLENIETVCNRLLCPSCHLNV